MTETLARRVSAALAVEASLAAATSFFFWGAFHRDAPAGVGNLRGTALTILVLVVPILVAAMTLAARGSTRARIVWVAALVYLAYNAVMLCFAARFNAYFLLYTTLLGLSFWALVTRLAALDPVAIEAAGAGVPVRSVALYLLASAGFFAYAWLREIVPAILHDELPAALGAAGIAQNPVWVLDFAFTFPLMVIGAVRLWRRRPWGVVIGGAMTVMLALETAGVAVDQTFGHLHDPTASLDAVPPMIALTALGVLFSALLLRGIAPDVRT